LQRIWCFILHVTTSETYSSLQSLLRGELISETHGMSVRAALKIKSKGQISSHLSTFRVQHVFLSSWHQFLINSFLVSARTHTHGEKENYTSFAPHSWRWPFDLWLWTTFQQCPLTWWNFMPSFNDIPPLSKEIYRYAK